MTDFVVSSRIRLARNIEGLPYPAKLRDARAEKLGEMIFDAVQRAGSFELIKINELDEITAGCLKEKHLISPALIENEKYGAVILNGDESVSIMVCEEDCVREQAILSGFRLEEAFSLINNIDDTISKSVGFCFDPVLGYLTSCPTNLGTGMRASAMMFLPALTMSEEVSRLINALSRVNITVRGVYGEGSAAEGYLYQVSNQKSLGISESQILQTVSSAVSHITDLEKKARNVLLDRFEIAIKDKIFRAYGILTNSYSMESKEFMEQIALVKLGIYYGLLQKCDTQRLEKLIIQAQPYYLQSLNSTTLDGRTRDILRSKYVRQEMLKLNLR